MTTKEAKRLLPRTVVMWNNDPSDMGTVLELGTDGFYVRWENGESGWIAYDAAESVSVR